MMKIRIISFTSRGKALARRISSVLKEEGFEAEAAVKNSRDPESLKESAYIDGANDVIILFKIIVPLIKATLAVLLLYYGVAHWNAWFNASIYLKDNEKLPIQNIMRAILIANSNVLNSAAAENDQVNQFAEAIKYSTIILTTVPVLCIYPFIQKYFVKGVMIGAVKG